MDGLFTVAPVEQPLRADGVPARADRIEQHQLIEVQRHGAMATPGIVRHSIEECLSFRFLAAGTNDGKAISQRRGKILSSAPDDPSNLDAYRRYPCDPIPSFRT